jgi:nicotinate-nucleotide adenylyltransferase
MGVYAPAMARSRSPSRPPSRPQFRPRSQPPITPLPARARSAGTLLLYGGTFDPPHAYHTLAPRLVMSLLGLESLGARGGRKTSGAHCLLIPAARNPLKAHAALASDAQRLAMLRASMERGEPVSIWTDEMDRARWLADRDESAPSYTIDTIRRLRTLVSRSTRLRLLIGVDQALQFHRWKDARELLRLAPPLVMPRDGIDSPLALATALHLSEAADFWTPQELGDWSMRMAPAPLQDMSSTAIRAALAGTARERSAALCTLPEGVAKIIRAHTLYGRLARPRTSGATKSTPRA